MDEIYIETEEKELLSSSKSVLDVGNSSREKRSEVGRLGCTTISTNCSFSSVIMAAFEE